MPEARRRGFTLIELMVVIVILGTLVALVGPNVWRIFARSTRKAAEFQITNFRNAIDQYYLDERALPGTLEDLRRTDPSSGEPWLQEIPPDPWGQPYEYRVLDAAKREYVLSSLGEDKRAGSVDDIEWTSTGGFKAR